MNYKADSNQIGFMQLLSTRAAQNITYHCYNSVAYFDATQRTYKKGIKLQTWNDAEILPRSSNRKLNYDVTEDECRVRCKSIFCIKFSQFIPIQGICFSSYSELQKMVLNYFPYGWVSVSVIHTLTPTNEVLIGTKIYPICP